MKSTVTKKCFSAQKKKKGNWTPGTPGEQQQPKCWPESSVGISQACQITECGLTWLDGEAVEQLQQHGKLQVSREKNKNKGSKKTCHGLSNTACFTGECWGTPSPMRKVSGPWNSSWRNLFTDPSDLLRQRRCFGSVCKRWKLMSCWLCRSSRQVCPTASGVGWIIFF